MVLFKAWTKFCYFSSCLKNTTRSRIGQKWLTDDSKYMFVVFFSTRKTAATIMITIQILRHLSLETHLAHIRHSHGQFFRVVIWPFSNCFLYTVFWKFLMQISGSLVKKCFQSGWTCIFNYFFIILDLKFDSFQSIKFGLLNFWIFSVFRKKNVWRHHIVNNNVMSRLEQCFSTQIAPWPVFLPQPSIFG